MNPWFPRVPPPSGRLLCDRRFRSRRSEAQYKQYWINKLFSDGAQTAPRIVSTPGMTANLVREIPGAVALVRTGRLPAPRGDRAYPWPLV